MKRSSHNSPPGKLTSIKPMSSKPTPGRPTPVKPLPGGDWNENPADLSFMALLREDFETHGSDWTSPCFWALAVHRFGNWRMGIRSKALRAPLTVTYRTAYHLVIAFAGIDLPYNAKIGRRFKMGHHGCILLGARAVGDDVHIRHMATIGLARRTDRSTAPTLGNRVDVGPGACIVGGIHVGDDCHVGPNTVLAEDLPAGMYVLGVPARRVDPLKATLG